MVKDLRYIFKRILIGVGIALVLSFLRGNLFILASAKTVGYKFYDDNYNLLYESDGSYSFNGNIYNVRYARVLFDDSLIVNDNYSLSSQFGITGVTDYAWIYWDGSSGVNVNGSYIITYPFSASTSNQQDFGNGSYYKQSNLMFNFKPTSIGSSNWFLQLDFGIGINIRFFELLNYSLTNLGNSNDDAIQNSTSNIINNNNENTQNIINNQNQNNQNIINNQNSNTQDIINNQNQNAEDTQNVIKNQFENCIDEQVVHPEFVNVFLSVGSNYQGYMTNSNTSGASLDVSKYVGETITITFSDLDSSHNPRTNYCFANNLPTSTRQACLSYRISGSANTNNSFTLTVPNSSKYLYLVGYTNYIDRSWINNVTISLPKVCSNRLNDINNSLNDDSGVDNSEIEDLFGDIRGNSNSPVSDLLTLPITLLQAYLDGMSGTCSPYTLGTLYGTTLVLPCIDIPGIIGTSLWNIVDALFCLYMIYNVGMMCISIYESFTSLDDSMQLLYSPQHSGHTRVSRNEGEY